MQMIKKLLNQDIEMTQKDLNSLSAQINQELDGNGETDDHW